MELITYPNGRKWERKGRKTRMGRLLAPGEVVDALARREWIYTNWGGIQTPKSWKFAINWPIAFLLHNKFYQAIDVKTGKPYITD